MRKFVLVLTVFVLANLPLMALVLALPDCCNPSIWPAHKFNVWGAVGWREDDFNWTTRNPPETPNVISKLKWSDLRMVQFTGGARYICKNYVARFRGDYARIYTGQNKDLDYFDDGQGTRFLFSESKNKSNRGYVFDLSPGVGYQLTSNGGRCIVTPMGGWSYREQHLHMTNGNQVINVFDPTNVGHFPGLNSKYTTRWMGGWLGLDFETKVECNAWLFGGVEYHWLRYHAKGIWNLRPDMPYFRHRANAQGYILNLGFSWECIPNFTMGMIGDIKFFRTSGGEDTSHVVTPDGEFSVDGRLTRVHWHSISFAGFLGYRF